MKDLAAAEKQVESPDGTLRIFRSDGKLRRISDPFGNWVDVTYPSSSPGGYDRLTVFTRTAGGDLMREQYYGGDTQFVATTAVCNVALPSSDRYRLAHTWQYGVLKTSEVQTSTGGSIGVKPVDRDVDSSGLVSVERDVAGLATSFEYDPLGRVSSRSTSWANATSGDAFTQGWTYDDLGAVTTLTYPRCTHAGCTGTAASSRSATFSYTNGALTAAASTTSPTMGSNALAYHADGTVASVTHANGVTWSRSADPNGMGRPASFQAALGTTSLWSTGSYLYDGSGNVRAIGASTFVYDPVSRLTSTSLITTATGGGAAKTQSFTYDAFGNLKDVAGTVGRSIPVDAASNRLTAAGGGPTCESTEVWYDAAGNLLCWHGNGYTYDGLGAVTRTLLSGVEYDHVYTAGGERLFTYQPGVGYRWTMRDLDGKVLRELKNNAGTWTVERDYLYRDGELLAAKQPTGEVFHLHPDHLGTPRLATGNGGAQRAFHTYYPFGEEATAINQDGERMKFTGHERDLGQSASAADDLDYMHARWANPQLGRFLSVDPVHGTPRAPQTWNRYSYVANRPLVFVDPWGLDDEECPDCKGAFGETVDVVGKHWKWRTSWLGFLSWNPFGGRGGGGFGGGTIATTTNGTAAGTEPRPCNDIDRTLGKIGELIEFLGPVTITGALPLYPDPGVGMIGPVAAITARPDGSSDLYIGGGLVLGSALTAWSPSLGGSILNRGTGERPRGHGLRAAVASPLLGPIGVRGSGFMSNSGNSASVGAGLVGGWSASLTYGGYIPITDPYDRVNCQ